MALSLQQVQKQTQRLIMTPQMQQSIQLLQMTSMDLEQLVQNEMLDNPFLELADEEEALSSGAEDAAGDDYELLAPEPESGLSDQVREQEFTGDEDGSPIRDLPATQYDGESPSDPSERAEGSEDFQNFADTDVDWNEQYEDSDITYSSTKEDFEEHDFTTYTSAPESLYDSLVHQLHLSILADKNFEIGQFLIGSLNHDGYLDSSLKNQCLLVGYPVELVDPDAAGSVESVDRSLRKILSKLHSGENPDAFMGMKRKELIHRIIADLLHKSYDRVASMKQSEQLLRLLARRLKRDWKELSEIPKADLLLEVIAWRLKVPVDTVFDVLEIIQEFEPTGIAARDLAECLRLQCEENGIRNRVLYKILDDHLDDLQQKRFREIAKALEVPEEQVTDVFTIISHLDPKPGRSKTADQVRYISPDVFVKKIDGKFLYFLNEGDVGKLKIASSYRRMMVSKKAAKAAAAAGGSMVEGQWETHVAPVMADVEYASEKYKNAVWLIRNIEKRKSTILRVTEAIMEYQKEFLEKGIEHLRPLTLRDIAERVGMHESTIARVTTKKYVETPRGIFELKYFFSSGLETDDGEAASSRSIKELLTQMIEAEEKRRPLSDQKIADMLRAKGFQIARRTVAKYREQLKILPAKLRKEVK